MIPIGQRPISWANIGAGVQAYIGLGYQYIEVPWYVSDASVNVTMPSHLTAIRCVIPHHDPHTQDTYPLVGSAEQSFIEMRRQGRLPDGDYVAATPCFRAEVAVDHLHQVSFFKVELIRVSEKDLPVGYALVMAQQALKFFRSLPGGEKAEIVKTSEGWDIELNGIELGSYGRRSFQAPGIDMAWIYGTGIAEPRFSTAVSMV